MPAVDRSDADLEWAVDVGDGGEDEVFTIGEEARPSVRDFPRGRIGAWSQV